MKGIDKTTIQKYKEMRGDIANFLKTKEYNQTEILHIELKGEQALAFRMLKAFFGKEEYSKLVKKIIGTGLHSTMVETIRATDDVIQMEKARMFKRLLGGEK